MASASFKMEKRDEVNVCIKKMTNEGQSSEGSYKEHVDEMKIQNNEELKNREISNNDFLKKVTFSTEDIFKLEDDKKGCLKNKENELKKEENLKLTDQNTTSELSIKDISKMDQPFQHLQPFGESENNYKEWRNDIEESREKFEKIEHRIDAEGGRPLVFLNEEEIKKILTEGETNGYEQMNYMDGPEETLEEGECKDIKDQAKLYARAYEQSKKSYNSSSFINVLNSLSDNKMVHETTHGVLDKQQKKDIINYDNKNYVNTSTDGEWAKNDVCIISCILCGYKIKSNASKMCNNCLLQNIEVASVNISKDSYMIYFCRDCKRYLHNRWVYCELESKELLALCLKKVVKLKKLKVQSAKFLYTEPHSKRLKIQLSVQEELIRNFISEMDIVLHYTIKYTQCDDCKKKYTPHTYNTCVSVRQKVEHKKTLLFLEHLILKNNMNENVINIIKKPDGLDFHFNSRTDGMKFCDFVLAKTISKCKASKHLITHDVKNNTYNYKYSFAIDICPICKYDLIFIDKDLANKYGIKSFFYLCIHAAVYIMLIHPFSVTNNVYVSQERYHKYPFLPLLNMTDAKIFLILNVEYVKDEQSKGFQFKRTIMNTQKKRKSKKKRGKNGRTTSPTYNNYGGRENKRLRQRGRKRSFDDERIQNKQEEEEEEEEEDEEEEGEETEQRGEKEEREHYNNRSVNGEKNTENIVKSKDPNWTEETENSDVSDFDTLLETNIDAKSCKSSSRKIKLDKLVYAYVELYDESTGGTVLTMTYNAKHLKPGDYVNVYDLRTQTVNDETHQFLENNDIYRVIIIDKVKAKQKRKIVNELSINCSNIETMKQLDEERLFSEKLNSRCQELENVHL